MKTVVSLAKKNFSKGKIIITLELFKIFKNLTVDNYLLSKCDEFTKSIEVNILISF